MSNSQRSQSRRSRAAARTRARIYALRLLYQQEMISFSIRRILDTGSHLVENDMAAECQCPHIEQCVPRAQFETTGQWPMDYACPYEDYPASERSRKCARSKVCRCRRYYLERKECSPPGYPFEDGDMSVDRCRCIHYRTCEYREFFDSFAVEPDAYAAELALGVERNLAEIDRVIADSSEHWSVFRMPVVDRNILRVAVYEMHWVDDVPDSVAINEAVSIAKEYGGEDSSKFVNGVLGKIARLRNPGSHEGGDSADV